MQKRETLLNHINSYSSRAIEGGMDESKMEALLSPLLEAVNAYYGNDLTSSVAKAINGLTHCLIRTGIKYKGQAPQGSITGGCRGWSNVTDIFLSDEVIINTGYADFINSITEEVEIDEVTAESSTYYKSSLVESWTVLLSSDAELIPQDLAKIAEVANSSGLGDSLQDAFEPKEIESVPDMKDIAKDIYIDRRYKALIDFYQLDVFVPSFL